MQRLLVAALFVSFMVLAAAAPLTTSAVSAAVSASPTFNKDVLPILQKNCQECHRPGAIAPMSFLTFTETRPYARAIAKAVAGRTMPPWFADPAVGHFENAKVLSDAEIATIAAWAEKGAAEGNAKDRPAPVVFDDGWTIGKPDIVVTMPKDVESAGDRRHRSAERARVRAFRKGRVGEGRRSASGQPEGGPSHEGVDPAAELQLDERRARRRAVQSAARSHWYGWTAAGGGIV